MDIFLLQAIANELELLLTGHRLGKIVQLNTTDVALDFRLRDGRWLVISTDPARLALYLTLRQPKQISDEPRTDTGFVSLMKKFLGSARLIGLDKLGYDRVVSFDFEAEDENDQIKHRKLIVSLTGRGANLLLVETGRIIARLREGVGSPTVKEGLGQQVKVLTHARATDTQFVGEKFAYPPPPADKLDPFQCSAAQLYDLIAGADGEIATAAQKNFIGFTPVYAREFAFRAKLSDPESALQNLLADLYESNPVPAIYSTPAIEEIRQEIGLDEFSLTLSPIELRHLFALPQTSFSTVNEAADAYFSLLDDLPDDFRPQSKSWFPTPARSSKNGERWRPYLNANWQVCLPEKNINAGANYCWPICIRQQKPQPDLPSPFLRQTQATITIPAADKANAQDAAEHYFKLARKAKNGFAAISTVAGSPKRDCRTGSPG